MPKQQYGPNATFEQAGKWRAMVNGQLATHEFDDEAEAKAFVKEACK